jgi:hypothetical protein|tara:strand:- start:43 stop:384 length:342 start_codon:yes stop_codon:yes gene_type:complete
MAHFAKLGVGNIVEKVVVVSNDIATSEQAGIDFLNNLYGTNDIWKQTSYNCNFRKNYAGKNFTYDESRDAFIGPQPYPSWILNEDTCRYDPPIEKPDGNYVWNELHRKWEEVT